MDACQSYSPFAAGTIEHIQLSVVVEYVRVSDFIDRVFGISTDCDFRFQISSFPVFLSFHQEFYMLDLPLVVIVVRNVYRSPIDAFRSICTARKEYIHRISVNPLRQVPYTDCRIQLPFLAICVECFLEEAAFPVPQIFGIIVAGRYGCFTTGRSTVQGTSVREGIPAVADVEQRKV